MSEWKEDANRRRDVRHMKEGSEETGPRKAGKPSPKKRERLTPIWVAAEVGGGFHRRVVLVSAEKRHQAESEGRKHLKVERVRVYVLHQKDRIRFADVLDTGVALDWSEMNKRWLNTIEE